MDPHAPDRIDGEGRRTWPDVVLSRFKPRDHHVSADDIFAIITAGRDGPAAAEVCAAKGVTVPMYCVWRVKYRHLTLDELRTARQRELWRGLAVLVAFLTVAVLGAGAIVVGLARAATAAFAATESSPPAAPLPARPTAATTVPFAWQPDRASAVQSAGPVQSSTTLAAAALARAAAAPAVQSPPRAAGSPPPTTEPGYKIQVAAALSLQEGRTIMARLASGGYPAYLARAMVGDAEVFRVRVGPFDTLASAEEIASRLHRDGYRGAWIAR